MGLPSFLDFPRKSRGMDEESADDRRLKMALKVPDRITKASARVTTFGAAIRAGQIADELHEPRVRDECKARFRILSSGE
jgi:hypothetical protein